MPEPVRVTLFNDAGCPWGYSANPAFRVLEWRYGAAARMEARADRADGRGAGVRRPGLHAAALGGGVRAALPPVWHAAGAEPAGANRRHRSLVPGHRVGAPAGAGPRVRRLQGLAVRVLHDDVASRRGREHRCRAATRGRHRHRSGDRGDRHARGRGGVPARSGGGPQCRRLAHAVAGQARDERRPRSLHGSVARVRARRPDPRGRRLADDRGLRRDRRQPGAGRRAPRSTGRRTGAASPRSQTASRPRKSHSSSRAATTPPTGSRPSWRCCASSQTVRRHARRSATTRSGCRRSLRLRTPRAQRPRAIGHSSTTTPPETTTKRSKRFDTTHA